MDVSFKRVFEQVQCAILSRRWCFLSRWSHFVELLCNFVDFNEWCVKFLPPLVTYYGLLNKIQASTVRMVATFSKVFRENFIIFCQNFGAIRLFFHHISWNFHAILIDLIAICVLSFIICHVLWSFEASFRQVKFVVLRFSKVFRENLIIFSQNLGAFRLFHHISWNFHTIPIDLILSYVCFPLSFVTYYGPLRQVCVKLRSWLCQFWKFLAQIVCHFAKILVFFFTFQLNWM